MGNLEDAILQLLQRRHTSHLLLGNRVAEDEVAEAHVLFDEPAQVDIHFLRVLVDEVEVFGLGLRLVLNLRALKDERHVFVALANLAQQLQTGFRIALLDVCQTATHSLHGEARVGDDAQHIIVVLLIPLYGFLVGRGQHYLWTTTLTLCSSVWVQSLGRKVFALCEDVVIQVGEHRGVEADVVLHQQYHLHTGLFDVVLDVHLVLYQLDD